MRDETANVLPVILEKDAELMIIEDAFMVDEDNIGLFSVEKNNVETVIVDVLTVLPSIVEKTDEDTVSVLPTKVEKTKTLVFNVDTNSDEVISIFADRVE
jgi:hypothetical protein